LLDTLEVGNKDSIHRTHQGYIDKKVNGWQHSQVHGRQHSSYARLYARLSGAGRKGWRRRGRAVDRPLTVPQSLLRGEDVVNRVALIGRTARTAARKRIMNDLTCGSYSLYQVLFCFLTCSREYCTLRRVRTVVWMVHCLLQGHRRLPFYCCSNSPVSTCIVTSAVLTERVLPGTVTPCTVPSRYSRSTLSTSS